MDPARADQCDRPLTAAQREYLNAFTDWLLKPTIKTAFNRSRALERMLGETMGRQREAAS